MNRTVQSWVRFALVAILLTATLNLLMARDREEVLPPRSQLAGFPLSMGRWLGKDLQTSAQLAETLGPGEFLLRDYVNREQRTAASLYIAYFPSQRAGDTIHSPKNCLPGAGWIPAETTHIWIDGSDGDKIEVNRILVTKGAERALVLYWYQAHGRVTPSEYGAKYYLVADAMRMNRSDGALVRIITFMKSGESVRDAETTAIGFAQLVSPLLDTYIPR
jgi:EpsI family protein